MSKKEVQTPEQKILKHLQGRNVKSIKTKDAQKITGFKGSNGYKKSAHILSKMTKDGVLKRIEVGVYELATPYKNDPPIVDSHTRRYHTLTMEEKDYYIKLRHQVRSVFGIEFDQVDKSTGIAKELYHKNVTVNDAAEIIGIMYKLVPLQKEEPLQEMNAPSDQFESPKEEVETNTNHTMQNNNHKTRNGKNYTFNNCTVTINEEGKAIEIMQQKQEINAKRSETLLALAGTFASILDKYADGLKKEPTDKNKGKLPTVDKTKVEKTG